MWDAVIIGSGFGGAMTAHRLVAAGARVLMIERGDWVPRGEQAWLPDASLELTPAYAKDIPYRCEAGGHGKLIGGYACVGGPSVYYGGVALRFRERDFTGDPGVVGDSGAAWPYRYDDLEPYYGEAEQLLRDADTAMYRAKDLGRNRIEFFDDPGHAAQCPLR
jgi:choline dehydrogenase-like flavoprotein